MPTHDPSAKENQPDSKRTPTVPEGATMQGQEAPLLTQAATTAPGMLRPVEVEALQRSVGNRVVQRMVGDKGTAPAITPAPGGARVQREFLGEWAQEFSERLKGPEKKESQAEGAQPEALGEQTYTEMEPDENMSRLKPGLHMVTDPNASVRKPPPSLSPTKEEIREGTWVEVIERSYKGGKCYVRVEEHLHDETQGPKRQWWTAQSNLDHGRLSEDPINETPVDGEPEWKSDSLPERTPRRGGGGGSDMTGEILFDEGAIVAPTGPRSKEEMLAEIEAVRSTVSVTELYQREVKYINPEILSFFPVVRKGGHRREFFEQTGLIGLLKQRRDRQDEIGQIHLDIEKKQKALDGAEGRLEAAKSESKKKAVGETIAKHQGEIADLHATLEAIPAEIDALDKQITAKASEVVALLQAHLDGRQKETKDEMTAAQTKVEDVAKEIDDLKTAGKKVSSRVVKRADKANNALEEATEENEAATERLTTLQSQPLVIANLDHAYSVDFSGKATVKMRPASPGLNVDRPGGYIAGGSKLFTEELTGRVATEMYGGITDEAEREHRIGTAKKTLATLNDNEGRSDSLNTWDKAIITLGSGIAAAGVLQRVFVIFKEDDPDKFHELVGRWGIDIVDEKGKNPYFTVMVPPESVRQDDYPDIPSGTVLDGREALEFIASDEVLLAQLRRAGHYEGMREAMIEATLGFSMNTAFEFTFTVPVPNAENPKKPLKHPIRWADLLDPIASEKSGQYLSGTQAAIADQVHGAGLSGAGSLRKKISELYQELLEKNNIEDPARYDLLPREALLELVYMVADSVPGRRLGAFRREFPEVAGEFWATSKKKADD